MSRLTYFVHTSQADLDFTKAVYKHEFGSALTVLDADIDREDYLIISGLPKEKVEQVGNFVGETIAPVEIHSMWNEAPNLRTWKTKNLLWLMQVKHFVYIVTTDTCVNREIHELLTIARLWGYTSIGIIPDDVAQDPALLQVITRTNICIGEADIGKLHGLVATL